MQPAGPTDRWFNKMLYRKRLVELATIPHIKLTQLNNVPCPASRN
jgi:hypothetical protein